MAASLWIDFTTLSQLVTQAAESEAQEDDRIDSAEAAPDDDLVATWERYEVALRTALKEWAYPRIGQLAVYEDGEDADDFVDELLDAGSASLFVFWTLTGEGAGIWDGRWEHYLDEGEIESLTSHLKGRIGSFADDTGGGELPAALTHAAWATGSSAEDYATVYEN